MFTVHGQHFFVNILCFHIFCPQKTHNTTLFYRGTCIQGRCHLVTAAPSVQSCAYRSLCVTIELDSAASGDSLPHLIQKRRSQLGFVTYLLNYLRVINSAIHCIAILEYTRLGDSLPENGNTAGFQNIMLFLKHHTMEKVCCFLSFGYLDL